MATQGLLAQSVHVRRVPDSRQADSLVQIISILGARRRELRASVGERLLRLGARTSAFESRHVQLEARLASAEGHLHQILSARAGVPDPGPDLARARLHGLGTALMYVGGLLVLWVVLLELGLALGLT